MNRKIRKTWTRLVDNVQGIAITEFALVLPPLLILAYSGLEVANYAINMQRISQIAMMTADNASRLRTAMTESYVNQLFVGVEKAGASMDFKQHGRIILSSIQNNDNNSGQWIRWQRCFGEKVATSKYGAEGKGAGTSTALQDVHGLQAAGSSAIMFVEITYDYQPLIPNGILAGTQITQESAFVVRQRTDFSITGTTTNSCS